MGVFDYLNYPVNFFVISHLVVCLAAVLTGAYLIFPSKKGARTHRIVGTAWIVMILFIAIGSFPIQTLNPNGFLGLSVAHITSFVAILAIIPAWLAARRGRVRAHAALMRFVFYFGLLLAGSMTLMPGRLISTFLIGPG
jgi:uncharacterized membrane protein